MSDLEKRIDTNLAAEIEVKSPAFLPIFFGFKASAERRTERYIRAIEDALDVDREALGEMLSDADERTDIFGLGMRLSITSGDKIYSDTFINMVVNALRNPARIDFTMYVMSKLEGYSPLHLRVFWNFCTFPESETEYQSPNFHRKLAARIGEPDANDDMIVSLLNDLSTELIDTDTDSKRWRVARVGKIAREAIEDVQALLDSAHQDPSN